jgi:hypothetical protein
MVTHSTTNLQIQGLCMAKDGMPNSPHSFLSFAVLQRQMVVAVIGFLNLGVKLWDMGLPLFEKFAHRVRNTEHVDLRKAAA